MIILVIINTMIAVIVGNYVYRQDDNTTIIVGSIVVAGLGIMALVSLYLGIRERLVARHNNKGGN